MAEELQDLEIVTPDSPWSGIYSRSFSELPLHQQPINYPLGDDEAED